jgi:hypothetical protein
VTTFLHITNGTSIIPAMRDAGITGTILPWDDVLHEGPVPEGLGPAALRERRAAFIAGCGWGPLESIRRSLTERDSILEHAVRGGALSPSGRPIDEIVLWLEHDLYDQLQRLQILDRVPLDGTPRISAVRDDDYLGTLPPERFEVLFEGRREVTSAERSAARDGWTAFRAADPSRVLEVLPRVTVLSHLEGAFRRHLEQFPSIDRGLSRTEQQALVVIAAGVDRVGDVYVQSHHQSEPAIFMGDAAFLIHVGALLRSPMPLLATERRSRDLALEDRVALTDTGRQVLNGEFDRVRVSGIDRWLGGVQLAGTGPVWRWDAGRQALRLQ